MERTGTNRMLSHLGLAAALTLVAGPAAARITRIEIDPNTSEKLTFKDSAGVPRTFGTVGTYDKLRGKAFGEVDPNDPRNALIVDIGLAPQNERHMVEYSMDIYILKPTDLGKGNHKLFMEVNNRGGKLFGSLNLSGGGNNPTTASDAGGAFLMNQGYSLAWNGWDISASGKDALLITVPVAHGPNNATLTGRSYEYIVNDNATTASVSLAYPSVLTMVNGQSVADQSQATLTLRQHLTDAPQTVPANAWRFASEKSIALTNDALTKDAQGASVGVQCSTPQGTVCFKQSWIYELTYTARDPLVAGLGFAATRDFVDFLRNAKADDLGHPNPLAGDVQNAYAFTISQPGRYMNDFIWLGFNQSEAGRRVFDGLENWIAAGDGVALNFRFAQPGRTERNRQNHLYPEAPFPFAFPAMFDPLTKKTDGRGVRCAKTDTCPKVFEVISANEYWVKAGSLVHTDTRGNDIDDPANVRFYLLSSVEHTVGGAPPTPGVCQQIRNTTDPNPALRALLFALDEWVTRGTRPPKSEVPREDQRVFSVASPFVGLGHVPQEALGWPDIPGVTYTGVITVRHLFDFGPEFDQGILTINPPAFSGPVYPSFVSRVDKDGNEIAGIRLPPVQAPIATTSGWGLRAPAFGGPDGCESSGQWIPFRATKAERLGAGDPRKSLQERYKDHAGYVDAVTKAAEKLQKKRLLLPEDVQRYIDAAQASDVLR